MELEQKNFYCKATTSVIKFPSRVCSELQGQILKAGLVLTHGPEYGG